MPTVTSSAADALARLVAALDDAGIPRMLAGSFASSLHGVPRTTQDFDLLIDPSPEALRAFVRFVEADDWYVSEPAALDALRRRTSFNAIDNRTGWKADLLMLGRDDFSLSEWERRESHDVLGVAIDVASAEDTIISKLQWAKMGGGSERQLRDVAGVVSAQADRLDRVYVESWVQRLGLGELWSRVSGS